MSAGEQHQRAERGGGGGGGGKARTMLEAEGRPLMVKMVYRSCSCPCRSPTTVMRLPSAMVSSCTVGSALSTLYASRSTSIRYLRRRVEAHATQHNARRHTHL